MEPIQALPSGDFVNSTFLWLYVNVFLKKEVTTKQPKLYKFYH